MSTTSCDRNMLVGVLGLQLSIVSETQLIEAMKAWSFRKADRIEDILEEQKAIHAVHRQFLTDLADRFVRLHDDNPTESLASLSSMEAAKTKLRELDEPDIVGTLTRVESSRQDRLPHDAIIAETVTLVSDRRNGNHRFRVLRQHAQGGLGVVSIAEDCELHREVALKEIKPKFADDHLSRSRFLIEAEVTGRLEHPGIVPVYSLGASESGKPFYAMRFIRGDSLQEAIHEMHGSGSKVQNVEQCDSTPSQAIDMRTWLRKIIRRLVDVCNAVQYAHSRGVLHRDLKPSNIMLGKYGETLVVDWGLARVGQPTDSKKGEGASLDEVAFVSKTGHLSSHTQMGSIVGSLPYMSPEQAAGRLDLLGPASDVYSLGATLYAVLTGDPPVSDAPPETILELIRLGNFPRPRELNPQVPLALEAICLKAIHPQISLRYASASQLAEDLENWLADEPVTAFREPLLDRLHRYVRRHRAWVTTGVGVAMTGLVSLAIMNWMSHNRNVMLRAANLETDRAKDLAIENLAEARELALSQTKTAEQILSQPELNPQGIMDLRKTMTETALENYADWYASNPDDRSLAKEYAQVARIASNLKRMVRQFDVANERIQTSIDIQTKVPIESRTASEKDYLALTLLDQGVIRAAEGRLSEARSIFDSALTMSEELRASDSNQLGYMRTQATLQYELAGLDAELMKYDDALRAIESCAIVFEKLNASDEKTEADLSLLLLSRARRIRVLRELDRKESFRDFAQAGILEARTWRMNKPMSRSVRYALALMLISTADGKQNENESLEEALKLATESIVLCDELMKASPNASYISGLSAAYRIQGTIFRKQSKFTESLDSLTRSKTQAERLLKTVSLPDYHALLAHAVREIALTQSAMKDLSSAKESIRLAIQSQQQAVSLSPESLVNAKYLTELENDSLNLSRQP